MKYFIDTEFSEKPNTIDLISIGIVNESGESLYAINKECDVAKIFNTNNWVRDNVLLPIYRGNIVGDQRNRRDFTASEMVFLFDEIGTSILDLREGILEFIGDDKNPEFWGYYSAYDWVVFCWIFGKMIDLPKGFPMYCLDIKQLMISKGLDKEWKRVNCPDPEGKHDALVDAKWNKKLYDTIMVYVPPISCYVCGNTLTHDELMDLKSNDFLTCCEKHKRFREYYRVDRALYQEMVKGEHPEDAVYYKKFGIATQV